MSEDRGQMSDVRRQRSDDRGQTTEDRRQKSDDKGQISDDRGYRIRKSECGSRKMAQGGAQKIEDREQTTEDFDCGLRIADLTEKQPIK